MKKGLTVFAASLLIGAFAPPPAPAQTGLGIRGGSCASKVRWSLDDGSGGAFRKVTAGVFVEISLGPGFAVQPELDFVTMGYSWWVLNPETQGMYEDTLQYVQVPVLFKARLLRKGWVVPAVFAGPSLGILLRARVKYTDIYGDPPYSGDIKNLYRNFDPGGVFGAGVDILVRNIRIIFDVRYFLGLTDVYRAAGISVKNAGLMITGGLGF
jgi:hypothetical protein